MSLSWNRKKYNLFYKLVDLGFEVWMDPSVVVLLTNNNNIVLVAHYMKFYFVEDFFLCSILNLV